MCAHVRCAVARVRVRAKPILGSVRDVRACDPTFAHFLGQNCQKMLLFVLKIILELNRMSYPVLERPFLLCNVLSCFGSYSVLCKTSYSVLEHPKP